MKTKEQETLESLPVKKISRKAFDSLYEYSCTNPSGVFPGKVWKRNLNAYTFGEMMATPLRSPRPPLWILCKYVTSKPGHCQIEFKRPEIVDTWRG